MSFFGFLGDVYSNLAGQTDPTAGQEQQAATRGQQQSANNVLNNWAMGNGGPSSAQALVQRNRAENAANQVGMAKTMGGDPALANRNASEGIARGNAEATYQGALIRNQEQQQAMQNYLQNLQNQRAQDVNVYGTQAGVNQTNAANAQQFWEYVGDKASGAMGMGF